MGRTSDAKEKLLAAALELIWTNSYGAVGVEQICERAGVNKGSFYHFFPSKADLAVAAFEESWQRRRPAYDEMFSPLVSPLDRLRRWCCSIYEGQKERFLATGFVCGCPYTNIGAELSTQDERLRIKSAELLDRGLRYLESAIADAQRDGMIATGDAKALAKTIGCAATGLIVQAKVRNDPELLRGLEPMISQILALPAAETAKRR
jgi:TetR/AcrR family transcriptional repressor of nem operon